MKQLIFMNKIQYVIDNKKVSELEDFLKSGYYKTPSGYENVDWFVDEVKKVGTNRSFTLRKQRKISY